MATASRKKPTKRPERSARKKAQKKTPKKAKSAAGPGRKPNPKRRNGKRKSTRKKKANDRGRREAPIKREREPGVRAAKAHARAAAVLPEDSNAMTREASATGRMHAVLPRELQAPKPRPAGLTREQRKKATNEEGFGFRQIEERLDAEREVAQRGTTRDKSGIVAERRKAVPEFEDEVKEGGVENSAGYVDYDKQERTSDEESEVDIEAPVTAEEE